MKKRILSLLLVAAMAFTFCACGNGTETGTDKSSQADSAPAGSTEEESSSAVVDDGKVTYKVTVVDENNTPLKNVMVQLCKDSCLPGNTGESGTAEFRLAEDSYKASIMGKLPEGYEYSTEATEFYFEDGSYELTIVLKSVQ